MTRYLYLAFLLLVGILLASLSKLQVKNEAVPYFMRYDSLAANAHPLIQVSNETSVDLTENQLEKLQENYAGIWAHLNRMFQNSDPKPSQEWFTERFYSLLAGNFQEGREGVIQRKDLSHHLILKTWSKDGLSCNLIDSLARFDYVYPDGSIQTIHQSMAISLLFQGDNWRLDALKIIEFQN